VQEFVTMSLEALKTRFKGVFAFPITPFKPANWLELDVEGLRRNIKFLLENGVRALVPTAGTGEIHSLTLEEHKKVIEAVVEEARGHALVLPGVPGATKTAIELARYAESMGADAVLAFPPGGSEKGLLLHYQCLADAVNIGMMAYNTMGWRPEFIAELAQVGKVIAVKDEVSDLKAFSAMVRLVGDRLAWICGIDHSAMIAHYYFMAGMQGFTCGLINFAPRYELEIYEAGVRRDYEKVLELQRLLAPIARLRAKTSGNLVKEAMNMVGLTGGSLRPPQIPMREEERMELKRLLIDLGLQV